MLLNAFTTPGLSADGRLCFVSAFQEETYLIWDIRSAKPICIEDGEQEVPDHPDLEDWMTDGYIQLDEGPGKGRYRIFGLLHNHPMLEAEGVALSINGKNSEILLKDLSTGNLLQTLGYHSLSGDWAAASFSEDGSIIAVAEPYYITFFSRVSVV